MEDDLLESAANHAILGRSLPSTMLCRSYVEDFEDPWQTEFLNGT